MLHLFHECQMDHDTNEGMKVCTYYNLITLPAVLVIDPITGQKMQAWNGMVRPERLLEVSNAARDDH